MEFDLLKKACDYINDFCLQEFDNYADFSELNNVPIAYTEDDEGNGIQVYIDLLKYRIVTEHQGQPEDIRQYASLEELIDIELRYLDFSELVAD